jgi:hypothetical protein
MAKKNKKDSSQGVYGTQVGDFNKFLNSDGYLKGGIDGTALALNYFLLNN